jgi:hypothetical protein
VGITPDDRAMDLAAFMALSGRSDEMDEADEIDEIDD